MSRTEKSRLQQLIFYTNLGNENRKTVLSNCDVMEWDVEVSRTTPTTPITTPITTPTTTPTTTPITTPTTNIEQNLNEEQNFDEMDSGEGFGSGSFDNSTTEEEEHSILFNELSRKESKPLYEGARINVATSITIILYMIINCSIPVSKINNLFTNQEGTEFGYCQTFKQTTSKFKL